MLRLQKEISKKFGREKGKYNGHIIVFRGIVSLNTLLGGKSLRLLYRAGDHGRLGMYILNEIRIQQKQKG
jgi:hypothetical protein